MASTLLASTAIMLSSLIAMLMGSSTLDKSRLVLVLLTVQSIRYYSHASLLINVPLKDMKTGGSHLTVDYVARSVNRGGYFWSLGLRAFYFSLPLLLWLFGPVPMFLLCFVLVSMLYFLDVTLEDPGATSAGDGEDGGHVLMNHQDPDHCQLTTSQHRV
ncbi:unnamed protein product [Linum tenue]|uniref:Uncharacterized protein n=1 Tax=Linum tenue TaxID=586396 RepID=A0AAV0Q7U3_9ROSI|nr:unnamed protein product [Linum tenue]